MTELQEMAAVKTAREKIALIEAMDVAIFQLEGIGIHKGEIDATDPYIIGHHVRVAIETLAKALIKVTGSVRPLIPGRCKDCRHLRSMHRGGGPCAACNCCGFKREAEEE